MALFIRLMLPICALPFLISSWHPFASGKYILWVGPSGTNHTASLAGPPPAGSAPCPASIRFDGTTFTMYATNGAGIASELRGIIGKGDQIRFGLQEARENAIVSVHYVGTFSGSNACGSWYYFMDGRTFEGVWSLTPDA